MSKLKFLILAVFLCSIGCATVDTFIKDREQQERFGDAIKQQELDPVWGSRMALTLPVKVETPLGNQNNEFLTTQIKRQLETVILKYPNLQIKSLSETAERDLCKCLKEDTNPSIALPAPFYVFQLQLTDLIIGGVSFGCDQSVGNKNIASPSYTPQSGNISNIIKNSFLEGTNKTEQNVIRVQLTVYEVKKNGTILKVGSTENKANFGKVTETFSAENRQTGYVGSGNLKKVEDIKEATLEATALAVYDAVKAIKARIIK